jgi:hypothetical protein
VILSDSNIIVLQPTAEREQVMNNNRWATLFSVAVMSVGFLWTPLAQAAAGGNYKFAVELAPHNLYGASTFTVTIGEEEYTGTLNITGVAAKGALSGTVTLLGRTYSITKGALKSSNGKMALKIAGLYMEHHKFGMSGKLVVNEGKAGIVGKLSASGEGENTKGNFQISLTTAPPVSCFLNLDVTEGEKGTLAATGTATVFNENIALQAKGKANVGKKGGSITLAVAGEDFKFQGKGPLLEDSVVLSWKAASRGCSASGGVPKSSAGKDAEDTSVVVEQPDLKGYDLTDSPGYLELDENSASQTFPLTNAKIGMKVVDAKLSPDPVGTTATLNGYSVTGASLTLQTNFVGLSGVSLQSGANKIVVTGKDTLGLAFSGTVTVYAGTSSMTVTCKDELGAAVSGATVTATLVDDNSIISTGTTDAGGQVTLTNLAARTFIIDARKIAGNLYGTAGAIGSQSAVTVTLKGFNPISLIDNNDISLGTTDGWEFTAGTVTVTTHEETPPLGETLGKGFRALTDYDLTLTTSGEGPQTLSRTFMVGAGTTAITTRYKFITSEVPGGYFGSKFNDYFSVTIRTLSGGGLATEANSMNGLGLAAFSAGGATDWREVTLPVSISGDTVQVDVVVANVGDGAYDSQVIVDKISEDKIELSVTSATRTLLQTNAFEVKTESSGTVSDYKIEIRRAGQATWYTLATQQKVENYKQRIAGKFKLRAKATFDGKEHTSPEVDLEVQFPSYSDIVGDATVSTKLSAAWQNTLSATTTTTRREEFFWILLNTTPASEKYEFTETRIGPLVDNDTTASVSTGATPADNPASPTPVTEGATYMVGDFHTHTPTTHRAYGRKVGPSNADITGNNAIKNVGVVYDYTAADAAGNIPAGHPLNSAAQTYHSGPTRRPTP